MTRETASEHLGKGGGQKKRKKKKVKYPDFICAMRRRPEKPVLLRQAQLSHLILLGSQHPLYLVENFTKMKKWSNRPKNYINRKVLRCLIDFVWLTRPFFFLFVRNFESKLGYRAFFCHFLAEKSKLFRFRCIRKALLDVSLTWSIVR